MSKKCHICGKEVKENYYLDKRGYTCYTCSRAIASKRSIMKNTKEVFRMTAKRFYYNTFYHRDNMSRVLEYEIIDRQSYPNYPYHNEKEDIPQWYIYIGENDSGWQDMLVDLLNELHEENEQLKQRNDRQAKQLAELYELMAKKDWESLTEIIDDFKRCDEQLRREWRNLNIQVGLDND